MATELLPLGLKFAIVIWIKRSIDQALSQRFTIPQLKSKIPTGRAIRRCLCWGMGLSLIGLVTACNPAYPVQAPKPAILNSLYTNEQPTLSGNGRYVAFVSNRQGDRQIVMYDLQAKQFVDLPRLTQPSEIVENPSLSRNGRYLTYITSDRGQPAIKLYDRLTQRSEVLTRNYKGWVRNPSISPDGRYVVFETSRRGQWDVEVLDRGANVELDIPDGNGSN